jgi:hypothetical protein
MEQVFLPSRKGSTHHTLIPRFRRYVMFMILRDLQTTP